MPKLRPARTPEEAAAVPADKPVTIELAAEPKDMKPPDAELTAEPDQTPPSHSPSQTGVNALKPAPAAEPEPQPDDNALAKQLADLKAAEALAQQELAAARAREQAALRQAQEREQELWRERGRSEQAEYDQVVTAISGLQAELDRAQGDLEAALAGQDHRLAADANRRMAVASSRLTQLEDGKAAWEARQEELRRQPPPPADPVAASIDGMAHLSVRQREWLKGHRDAFTDPAKNAYLGAVHWDAIRAGHAVDSDGYFAAVEERLGYRSPPAPPDDSRQEQQRRSIPVSAPVSREAPSLGGGPATPSRVTLSAEQREAARIAGVDEVTYARNLIRLNELKKQGHYQERG